MSYELYITRANNYLYNEDNKIDPKLWEEVVNTDNNLAFKKEYGEYFAIWHGGSRDFEQWLDWENGNIYTKYPDRALFKKMLEIAEILDAQVQGEGGEIYNSEEELPEIDFTSSFSGNEPTLLEKRERMNLVVEIVVIAITIAGLAVWRIWYK